MVEIELLGIGECMVELHDGGAGQLQLSYGGDVLNTLVYAQRNGLMCGFATVTGGDHYGHWLRSQWQAEGLDCSLVRHDATTSPALYIIRNDTSGERYFSYWREGSPFGALFDDAEYVVSLKKALQARQMIYLSGITVAMLDERGRGALLSALEERHRSGLGLAFDPNYRPRLWQDAAHARSWIDRVYACATLALPSLEDEQALRDAGLSKAEVAAQISKLGVDEIVVKDGAHGAMVVTSEGMQMVPAAPVPVVVDTTAAGDAFNGGYLAARLHNEPAVVAANRGALVAAEVIQHSGAISPREEL